MNLHHFRDYLKWRGITVHMIGTKDNWAHYLTNTTNETIHVRKYKSVKGW